MIPSPLRVQLTKEMRALLVPWLACAVAAVAGTRFDISGAAAGLGCLLLGAWSIGHEYSLGTLPMLLAQPVSRHRVLLVKLAVLTLMLVALVGVWMGTVRGLDYLHAYYGIEVLQPSVSALRLVGSRDSLLGAAVVVAVSVSLAPWLTILARNSLAGVIFTCAVAIFSVLAAGLAAVHAPGTITSRADVFSKALVYGVVWRWDLLRYLVGLCVLGAPLGWRTFMRLEAAGAYERQGPAPRAARPDSAVSAWTATSTRHSPLWLLLKKEWHLQQLTFVAAALFLIFWSAVVAARWLVPTFLGPSLTALTQLYGGVIALLAGSLSSAEERQMGTVEWQALLPVKGSRQWAVKIGTIVGVTVLFSVLLPVVLAFFDSDPNAPSSRPAMFSLALAISMVCLAIAGSYVSSLCTSGLRAFVITVAVVAGAVVLDPLVGRLARGGVLWLLLHGVRDVEHLGFGSGTIRWVRVAEQALPFIVLFTVSLLLLRASLANYRSLDRSPRLVGRQLAPIIACLVLFATIQAGMSEYIGLGMRYHFDQVRQGAK